MVSHAPTLVAGEVADRGIAQASVARNGGHGGDKGDQGEIDGGQNPLAEPGNEHVFDVGAVRISVPVQVLVLHQLPLRTPLPGVGPAVAVGVDGRLQPAFDHVQMAIPVPVLAGVQPAVAVAVLAAEHGDRSKLEKAGSNIYPGGRAGIEDGKNQQKAEHRHQFEGHHRLQRVVDLAPEDQRNDAGDQYAGGGELVHPPVQGNRVRGRHLAAKQQDHDRSGRRRSQIGKDGPEIEDQVDQEPELRSGQSPEFPGEDGLAGVEGIAADFDVVEPLGQDAEGRQPQQRASVAGRHQRPQQPLAPANGACSGNQAGAQEGVPVLPDEPGGIDQLARVPARHLAGTGVGRNETGWGRRGPVAA